MSEIELFPGYVAKLGLGTILMRIWRIIPGWNCSSASSTRNIRRCRLPRN
jgi:hypothetical protein